MRWRVSLGPPGFLCWLCLLSGLVAGVWFPSQTDEAVASPRIHQSELPWPLTKADAQRYRLIFALQQSGRWRDADRTIATIGNNLLMGHVLAQRYLHPTHYRSRYHELASWLKSYAGHPDARRIYKLALKRRPTQNAVPTPPTRKPANLLAFQPTPVSYRSTKRLTKSERRQAARYKKRIKRNLRRTYLSKTERLLHLPKVQQLFDDIEIDEAYSQLAAGWLYYGDVGKAFEMADKVARRSGHFVPIAHWTAGLAAWQLGRIGSAARHFEAVALSERLSAWNRSAGAYWAARVHLKTSNLANMQRWLSVAAKYPLTFYGMLARDRLALNADYDFQAPKLDPSSMEELLASPAGMRALALLQSGEPARSEKEILRLGDWKQGELNRAVMRFAAHAQLPRLSLMLARRVLSDDRTPGLEKHLVGALYPIPPWQPEEGFLIDRALIYAIMRQESSFDPLAKSPDGARGLMQLMPRTASALDPQRRYKGARRKLLYDPSLNIELGQRYLKKLLRNQRVRKDLLRLAVAYNAGPGNLAIWDQRMDYNDDSLLFLETLPARETRLFVERVLTNLWVYRQRLGQATPSLRALASGVWPEYRTIDKIRMRVMLQEAFDHRRDPGQARAVQSD